MIHKEGGQKYIKSILAANNGQKKQWVIASIATT